MDVMAEKIELVKMVLDTEDEALLQEIKDVFTNREEDFYSTLPEHVKEGIERSRRQATEGNYMSLDEAMARLHKK